MRHVRCLLSLTVAVALALAHAGTAHADGGTPADDVFTLGQITVTGERIREALDDTVISRDEMWRFNADTLDEAIKLTPGVMTTLDSNGRRNEHDIFIRGFGRWQVPLSIDGVRVYLPADNRLDFRRFLTADLAEIQIRKGYVSVLDGPGGMGGAINLVTRKPAKPFEAQFQIGSDFGRDGDFDAWNGYAMVGTRQQRFYARASVGYLDRDQWQLSGDYRPTSIQDGGDRDRSSSRDSRVNLKFGLVPNDTDEYSLSYTRQEGRKGAPLNVYNDPPVPPNSYWDWPWWDIENLYFLSHTKLGEHAYVKGKLFYNEFDNALYAYDDASYTTQSNNGRFRSFYFDRGYGGSVEFGFRALPDSDTRVALHYREDKHNEYNINRPTHPTLSFVEPVTRNRETTWSLALENTWQAGERVDVLAGVSYDHNTVDLAEEYDSDTGVLEYPAGGSHASNGQASVRWRYRNDALLAASVSSRTRFPTTFERFSTRFGTAVPNPDLGSERGTNYELSWEKQVAEGTRFTAALFYADVGDMIQTVVVATDPEELTQTRNVGDGEYYGIEFGGETRIADGFALGGNFTWLHRRIRDALQPDIRPVGAPDLQALLYATWTPTAKLTLTPNVEFAGDRWSDVTGGRYLRTGDYLLFNLQVDVQATDNIAIAFGGRNLSDCNYELARGFPEPGRTLFAKLQVGF